MSRDLGKQLVAEARKIARRAESWMALASALADPNGGLIVRYFPDPDLRQAFLQSPEYEQLNQLLLQTMESKGLYPEPASPRRASG